MGETKETITRMAIQALKAWRDRDPDEHSHICILAGELGIGSEFTTECVRIGEFFAGLTDGEAEKYGVSEHYRNREEER